MQLYFYSFWVTWILFSIVAAQIYIPTKSVRGFPFLRSLSSICYLSFKLMLFKWSFTSQKTYVFRNIKKRSCDTWVKRFPFREKVLHAFSLRSHVVLCLSNETAVPCSTVFQQQFLLPCGNCFQLFSNCLWLSLTFLIYLLFILWLLHCRNDLLSSNYRRSKFNSFILHSLGLPRCLRQ